MQGRDPQRHRTPGDRWPDWVHNIALLAAAAASVVFFPIVSRADTAVIAADFALKAATGENLRLSEYRGDVVVLTFWASWCGPCRQLLGELDELSASIAAEGPVVLGVQLDADARRTATNAPPPRLSFPTLLDTRQDVGRLYDVQRLPLTLLLDRDGVIRRTSTDPTIDAAFKAELAELIRP